MPNDCSNNLYVWGDEEALQKFVEDITVDGRIQILRSLYPCPTELYDTVAGFIGTDKAEEHRIQQEANVAKYGHKDWYDWCCANWGTKWGDYDTGMGGEDIGYRSFYFNSAWAPPEKAFEHISTLYPNFKFVLSYDEQGMGFAGASSYHDGQWHSSFTENITIEGSFEDTDIDIMWERVDNAYIEAREACEEEVRNAIGL